MVYIHRSVQYLIMFSVLVIMLEVLCLTSGNYTPLSPTLLARLYCEHGDFMIHDEQDEERADEVRSRGQELHAHE